MNWSSAVSCVKPASNCMGIKPSVFMVCALFVLVAAVDARAQGSPAGGTSQTSLSAADALSRAIARAGAERVTLAFRDTEIAEVVSTFGASLGVSFLLDSRVKGTISLETPRPMRLDEAYELLVSALNLQGFTILSEPAFAKVVPISEAKALVAPLHTSVPRGGLATRVFSLQHEDATQVLAAIRALVPAANPMTVHPNTNSIVVSDTTPNLERISEIIASLDRADPRIFDWVPVIHGFAIDLAQTVDQLINRSANARAGRLPPHQQLSFMPDHRGNRILIQGGDAARIAEARRLIAELDSPLTSAGNVNVVYLKNAEAPVLAQTLQGIFSSLSGHSGPPSASFVNSATSTLGRPPASASLPSSGAAATGFAQPVGPESSTSALGTRSLAPVSASGQGSDVSSQILTIGATGVLIKAEATLNALIVVAPPPIFRQIREVVDKLDVRRAQVYIESLIVEVSAERAAEFGVQFQFLDGLTSGSTSGFGGTNFNALGTGSNLLELTRNPLAAAQGLNIGVIRGTISFAGQTVANLGLLARALESQGNGNIIATPNLLTLDNEEAKIVIGQNVPFLTGSFTTSTGTANNPFQTIERRDVGTTLRVRPMVSEGGAVRMQIFQEVSSVSQRLSEGIITNKRSIESTVLIDDQQIVVLGGLIQDDEGVGQSKVPGLGDIPLIGSLFRYETRERRKTNLFVFLRPVVIRNADDSRLITQGRYESIRASQSSQPREGAGILPDLGYPRLPEGLQSLPGVLLSPSLPHPVQ